jgi:DnaK suppressor protein
LSGAYDLPIGRVGKDGPQGASSTWGTGVESGMATALDRIDTPEDRFPAAANDANAHGYRPSADEPFMSQRQQDYFRAKLHAWKDAIVREGQGTLSQLQTDSLREADLTDRASTETDWSIELRTRDRQRKLFAKIEAALRRIDDGEYGYCEVTGEPISLGRLEARPIATMTVEAQERHERNERVSRDD